MKEKLSGKAILDLVRGFQPSCVVIAGAELDVFTILHAKPMTAAQLARRIKGDLWVTGARMKPTWADGAAHWPEYLSNGCIRNPRLTGSRLDAVRERSRPPFAISADASGKKRSPRTRAQAPSMKAGVSRFVRGRRWSRSFGRPGLRRWKPTCWIFRPTSPTSTTTGRRFSAVLGRRQVTSCRWIRRAVSC